MPQETEDRNKDSLICEFHDKGLYNDLLVEAMRTRDRAGALKILNREDFHLDPDKLYDNNDNILMLAMNLDWQDVIGKILQQPKEVLDKLFQYTKNKSLNGSVIAIAAANNDVSILKVIHDKDLKYSYFPNPITQTIANMNMETVRVFPWGNNTLNNSGRYYFDATVNDYKIKKKMLGPVAEAMLRLRWDIANHLIDRPLFEATKNQEAYELAKKMRKTHPEAKEIADRLLEMIETTNPKRAKKYRRGFFGLGRH